MSYRSTASPDLSGPTLRQTIEGTGNEQVSVWCKVSDVRAALDDAERYRFLRTVGGKSWSCLQTGESAKFQAYDAATDAALQGMRL